MSESRFLVMRLGSLGDIVHTFPAVSGLRKSFPRAEVIWLTHPTWEFLVNTSNLAGEVWTVDTRNWSNLQSILKRIRAHQFAAAIDYQGLWKSAAFPFLAGVPKRIGFSRETVREAGVPVLYTDKVKVAANRHIADQNGQLTVRTGANVATAEVELRIADEDTQVVRARLASEGFGDHVVLSPGGGWASKCWPAERYGALADRILEQFDLRCVINVGPGEEELAAAVERAAPKSAPYRFAGSLGQLMALLKNARATIAGDTGPLHLADALGTRVVAIFGPTDPSRNGPYWRNGAALRWEGAQTSHRRATEPDESLQHISVENVAEALRGVLHSR